MGRTVISLCLAVLFALPGLSKGKIAEDFRPACRELDSLLTERTGVEGELCLKSVMKRGRVLDFYFSVSLSDFPWRYDDYIWFCRELKSRFPEEYADYALGRISSRGEPLENLVAGEPGFSGEPDRDAYRIRKSGKRPRTIVEKIGGQAFPEGLDGRHIALWQSHGLYYEQSEGRWEWQRPCLFQTVEDLFTQGYVLPFLVPMLENAGAYVILPRERDVQTHEIIIDNDPGFDDRASGSARLRLSGEYAENGIWEDAGTGFADAKAFYAGTDNPFTMGTARMTECIHDRNLSGRFSEIFWTPDIPERGEYAVYVSYKSFPNSTESAHYTVHHLGGKSEFSVNQKMGGGTWIYLGTFPFEKGTGGFVSLDNVVSPLSGRGKRSVVSADAVKIGGGYGNIARKDEDNEWSVPEISGMPRFAEASRYWLQWAGMDSTLYSQNGGLDDYKDDFMCRGDWSAHISGGSGTNPKGDGLNIPVDLTFALHSDAGTTPNDSTVGTLAIYTLKSENRRKLPSGEDRRTSREFADLVQSQIVGDIRAEFDPQWNRRAIWDRSYRESRTPASPAMLCELLSHQNFADMKYGLDPAFKFTVSRAIYKGMLKYLANRYGCSYAVQPLPVHSFSAIFREDKIRLGWKESIDDIEPTALPEGFIIRTRVDDGVFDDGIYVEADGVLDTEAAPSGNCADGTGHPCPVTRAGRAFAYDMDFEPGHLYSFEITAVNTGGKSFPSEILSAGIPDGYCSTSASCGEGDFSCPEDSCILIVNNFTRISAPAWFDSPEFAGFDSSADSGVPYIRDISSTGKMYDYRRSSQWVNDDCPGFGASYNDLSGTVIAGNTFDYPAVHGKAVMAAGYPFCSSSADAFCSDTSISRGKWCIDLVCGKQVTVKSAGKGMPDKFRVFPGRLMEAIAAYTASGGNVLVSGSHIATDIYDRVYPVETDSSFRAASAGFAENVLGFGYITGRASKSGQVEWLPGITDRKDFVFNNRPDSRLYSVESPDGIRPALPSGPDVSTLPAPWGYTFLKYGDTKISAGVCSDFGKYRTVCIGFPIETVTDENSRRDLVGYCLGFLRHRNR